MLFMEDASGSAVPISFKSYKAKRVTISAISGRVTSFSDLLNVAAIHSAELQGIVGFKVSVQLLTEFKSLFDIISKGSQISGKRMMVNTTSARECFMNNIISGIGFT